MARHLRAAIQPAAMNPSGAERIQKVLARAGLGSRRQIEGWITTGRIQVNGKAAELGQRIAPGDHVLLDGKPVELAPAGRAASRVLAYYKPAGEICTRSDPEGRTTVYQHLPAPDHGRWVSIGRLDYNTAGLLLFTNDGELAHGLMHPSRQVEREYAVRVRGKAEEDTLRAMLEGVTLDDGPARFAAVRDAGGEGANHWYHVVLKEGRNREVRRVFEAMGMEVSRLIRVRFGCCDLPRERRTGDHWELGSREVAALWRLARGERPRPGGKRVRK